MKSGSEDIAGFLFEGSKEHRARALLHDGVAPSLPSRGRRG